jgi:hypothetical protein
VQGVLNLIDLAGSERLNKSGATGDRLKETVVICYLVLEHRLCFSLICIYILYIRRNNKDGFVPALGYQQKLVMFK